MAKGLMVGIGGTNKKIKGGYVGVGGVNKKIKKILAGINGVNKIVWQSAKSDAAIFLAVGANSEKKAYITKLSHAGVEQYHKQITVESEYDPYSAVNLNIKTYPDNTCALLVPDYFDYAVLYRVYVNALGNTVYNKSGERPNDCKPFDVDDNYFYIPLSAGMQKVNRSNGNYVAQYYFPEILVSGQYQQLIPTDASLTPDGYLWVTTYAWAPAGYYKNRLYYIKTSDMTANFVLFNDAINFYGYRVCTDKDNSVYVYNNIGTVQKLWKYKLNGGSPQKIFEIKVYNQITGADNFFVDIDGKIYLNNRVYSPDGQLIETLSFRPIAVDPEGNFIIKTQSTQIKKVKRDGSTIWTYNSRTGQNIVAVAIEPGSKALYSQYWEG